MFTAIIALTLGYAQVAAYGLTRTYNKPLLSSQSTTTVGSTTSEKTRETQIMECINACRSTNQYNPVCGDDNTTYTNESKLKCAQRCNKRK